MTQVWPNILGDSALQEKIKTCNVLAVGAGGIGCELLKTLVLTGFRNIEVIDLDTIETSNLNRQFLFRKHHVGSSKAAVAAEVVRSFAPDAHIVAHQANVKEARFDVDYFGKFDVVLNGLDNLEARRHVNRLCVAAGTPLVESGTTGFLGQVTVHIKGKSECYECTAKPVPKSYPICTLRNTPDKPIHCIVWAKDMLFGRLFGAQDAVTDLDAAPQADAANGSADAEANESGAGEPTAAELAEEASFFVRGEGEAALDYAARVFDRVYRTDIERLQGHEELWRSRAPPSGLQLGELVPDLQRIADAAGSTSKSSAAKALGLGDQEVWSTSDNARVFIASIVMFLTQRASDLGACIFDKDDDLAVDFVAAASNLRSACYGIPTQSAFAAKGMAGNIIHAIATTNAIVSGMIVIEAVKILAGMEDSCTYAYLNKSAEPRGRKHSRVLALIMPERLPPPRPGCMVCGRAQLPLRINTHTTTLGQLVDKVLKKRLAVNQPTLLAGDFMYEEGEGLEEDEVQEYQSKLPVTLSALPGGGLGHGAIVTVQDQSQGFNVELIISHQDEFDEEQFPDGFELLGEAPAPQQEEPPPPAQAEQAGPSGAAGAASKKRPREGAADGTGTANGGADGEGADEADAKRARAGRADAEVVELGDDSDPEVITID